MPGVVSFPHFFEDVSFNVKLAAVSVGNSCHVEAWIAKGCFDVECFDRNVECYIT